MKPHGFRIVALVLMGWLFMGCSATNPVINEWRNPASSSANFKRILVSGPGFAISIRRNLEDEFAAQLRAAGIDGIPSYSRGAEEQADEASIKREAQKLGADAALVVRPLQVERKTEYGPNYFPAPWFGYYGPYFGASWYGWYGAPSVYRYNEYTSETTLYDIAKNEVVWSGTIRTTDSDNVQTAIKRYVTTVIRALDEKNLLAKPLKGLAPM
ncbi:MAG: hypothetical protein ACM35E_10135 [Deltaproteobacteria bacterium]